MLTAAEAVELSPRDQRGDRLLVAATSAPAGSAAVQICHGFSEHPEGREVGLREMEPIQSNHDFKGMRPNHEWEYVMGIYWEYHWDIWELFCFAGTSEGILPVLNQAISSAEGGWIPMKAATCGGFFEAFSCTLCETMVAKPGKSTAKGRSSIPTIFVGVYSASGNFEKREVVRGTWGRIFQKRGFRVKFFLGRVV